MLGKLVVLCKNDLANTIGRMKKPKPIDTFLYQHVKRTGHSSNDVLVQPVEKLTYDKHSSSRFKITKRHETELLKMDKIITNTFSTGI